MINYIDKKMTTGILASEESIKFKSKFWALWNSQNRNMKSYYGRGTLIKDQILLLPKSKDWFIILIYYNINEK